MRLEDEIQISDPELQVLILELMLQEHGACFASRSVYVGMSGIQMEIREFCHRFSSTLKKGPLALIHGGVLKSDAITKHNAKEALCAI